MAGRVKSVRGARARVRSRLPLRNTGGRLREVYPLRWKTNRRRRKRTLLGTSVADKLTKAILPRPSRPPHYRKPVDSRTIYTVKSPTRERTATEEEGEETRQRGAESGWNRSPFGGNTSAVYRAFAQWPASKSPIAILSILLQRYLF